MIENFVLRIKRGETPFYRLLRNLAQKTRASNLPQPRFLHPLFGLAFHLHSGLVKSVKRFISYCYIEPLFRGRCASLGKQFYIHKMPFVMGHAKIYIGDRVNFFGQVDIFSARIFDEPKLIIKDRVDIGHNVVFLVNKEIVIEEDVNVASGVRFMDSDAHPRDVLARIADMPPPADEIKPVRVCRRAWIGQSSFILKGVTIGEGAIIGVNSVVITDIPPYSIAMGNPAKVVMKNLPRSEQEATNDRA